MSKKTPEIGDTIRHFCSINGERFGKVYVKLSSQFGYITETGHRVLCMFNSDWSFSDKEVNVDLEDPPKSNPKSSSKKIRGRKSKKVPKPEDILTEDEDMADLVNAISKQEKEALKPKKGESVLEFMKRKRQMEES